LKVPLHSHSLCVGGRARLSAVRRAETPRSADRRAVVRWAAAAQTPLADDSSASFHTPAVAASPAPATESTLLDADDSSASFHTPAAGVTPVAPADAVAHAAAETPPARNIFFNFAIW
jgi:hypothetical protein